MSVAAAGKVLQMTAASDEIERRRQRLERQLGRWEPMRLDERFDLVAGHHPDRPYVVEADRSWSYAELGEWSHLLARGLVDLGVQPGERVALLLGNGVEFVAAKLAIARAGAVAVPLNTLYRAHELRTVLARSGASVLFSTDRSLATDFLGALDELVPGWPKGTPSRELPSLRQVVLVPPAGRDGALDLDGLAKRGRHVPESALRARQGTVSPDEAADLIFTSGTTGYPLAAVLTHDMVLRSAYGSAYHRGFADGWRIAFALPLHHVFAYVEGLLASLFAGGAVVPHAVFHPPSILGAIEREKVNEVLFVPTMTMAVLEQAAKETYDLSSLESVFSAAAPAPVWLWERVRELLSPRVVFTGYGQTEVSAATTLTLPDDPLEVVADTVGCEKLGGLAAPAELDGRLARYRTVDPFSGAELDRGTEGELSVRGPIVTRGYHEAPERNAELISDGWLRSGDLGRIRDDGYLELTGRSSELFKVGGELVSPKEVELLLTRYPGVAQAYVAGVPDERLGEVGLAWVVLSDSSVTPADLHRYCRKELAHFKVPRRFFVTTAEELPTTATGKVQKYRLVDAYAGSGGGQDG